MRANWILVLSVSAALAGCGSKSGTGGGYSTGNANGSAAAASTFQPQQQATPRQPAQQTTTPAISAITPATGDVAGGTQVMITGTGFDTAGVTGVTVNGVALTNVTVAPTELQGTTGPGTAGTGDVVVSSSAGTVSLPGAFTYTQAAAAPPPASLGFATNVQPIIKNDCFGCHNGSYRDDLTQYSVIMQYVTANSSASSLLYQKITTGTMAGIANAADTATIQQWIDSGAKP